MGLVQELQGFLCCALAKVKVLEARIFVGLVLRKFFWYRADYSRLQVVYEGKLSFLTRKPG